MSMLSETIQGKDLRIGNLFIDKENIICVVEEISINREDIAIRAKRGAITSGPIKPILLTDEIILKCDFIECEGKYGPYFKHKEMEGFRVWPDDIRPLYMVGRKGWESDETTIVRGQVKFLHRLQNLFYELTDTELGVKL